MRADKNNSPEQKMAIYAYERRKTIGRQLSNSIDESIYDDSMDDSDLDQFLQDSIRQAEYNIEMEDAAPSSINHFASSQLVQSSSSSFPTVGSNKSSSLSSSAYATPTERMSPARDVAYSDDSARREPSPSSQLSLSRQDTHIADHSLFAEVSVENPRSHHSHPLVENFPERTSPAPDTSPQSFGGGVQDEEGGNMRDSPSRDKFSLGKRKASVDICPIDTKSKCNGESLSPKREVIYIASDDDTEPSSLSLSPPTLRPRVHDNPSFIGPLVPLSTARHSIHDLVTVEGNGLGAKIGPPFCEEGDTNQHFEKKANENGLLAADMTALEYVYCKLWELH